MATIDVIPLHSEEETLTDAREERAETSSENNEKAEQTRKRGRPAGAKDIKPSKTPARQKKATSSIEAVQEAPPIEGPPKIEERAAAPAAAPVAVIPPLVHQAAVPKAVPEITPFQRHRMQYLERQSSRQAHWDGIVTPMFRFPVF